MFRLYLFAQLCSCSWFPFRLLFPFFFLLKFFLLEQAIKRKLVKLFAYIDVCYLFRYLGSTERNLNVQTCLKKKVEQELYYTCNKVYSYKLQMWLLLTFVIMGLMPCRLRVDPRFLVSTVLVSESRNSIYVFTPWSFKVSPLCATAAVKAAKVNDSWIQVHK